MRAVPDDEFKLRFPVAKDRTLRRIAIAKIILTVFLPVSFFVGGYFFNLSRYDDRWPDYYNEVNPSKISYWFGAISGVLFLLAIPALIIVNFIEGTVFTRRYGWRAVKDPIEAQRVAMREALCDVATDSTRAEVELERDGDRIMMVPVRRLRPRGARLELIAEREKAQAQHQGS